MFFRELDVEALATISAGSPFSDVIDFFRENRSCSLLVICDADNKPLGVISQPDFQQRIAMPFGHSLYQRRCVSDFMSRDFHSVQADASVADNFNSAQGDARTGREGIFIIGLVVLNEDGTVFGVLNPATLFEALMKLNGEAMALLREEITERKRAEAEIKTLAERDPLTNVLNRRAFSRMIGSRIDGEEAFACAFIDLDRFKQINDQLGHAAGDEVLKQIAQRLIDCPWVVRPARLGGDEFSFILEGSVSRATLVSRVQSILQLLTAPIKAPFGLLSVGASIGVSRFPADASSASVLMNAADRAMLRTKSAGGGTAFFDPSKDMAEEQHNGLERRVSLAVLRDAFRPAFQPVFSNCGQELAGHEMLARWPGSGAPSDPSPDVFLPIAERLGLAKPMFLSLLRQSVDHMPNDHGFLAVNVSGPLISDERFVPDFMECIEKTGIAPERIELEITEHVALRNVDRSLVNLNALRDHGVGVALDDFGTGYSALSHIDQLPITKIKLDKTIVHRITQNRTSQQILRAVVAMCRELGLISCAEGVETREQLEILQEIGCDQFQGYLLGRPEIPFAVSGETVTALSA